VAFQPTAGPANWFSAVSGNISAVAESDWYRISVQAGERILVETIANRLGAPGAIDTWLVLISPDGSTVLGTNDDCPGTGSFDSCINYTGPTTTGTYYIIVEDLGLNDTGRYAVRTARY
jgi:hypothetical protein